MSQHLQPLTFLGHRMPQTTSLSETQFVTYFRAPLNITILDVADWAVQCAPGFTIYRQMPPDAPVQLDAPPSITLVSEVQLPRLIVTSPNEPFAMSLQADRFSFSWVRKSDVGKVVEYPGFASLRNSWLNYLNTFAHWHQTRFSTDLTLRLVELDYINTLSLKKEDGSARKLSEVFKFVLPGNRPVNAFQASWTELFERKPQAPRVSAIAGVGLVTPIGSEVSVEPSLYFNFSGQGLVDDVAGNWAASSLMIDALHQRILDVYHGSIMS